MWVAVLPLTIAGRRGKDGHNTPPQISTPCPAFRLAYDFFLTEVFEYNTEAAIELLRLLELKDTLFLKYPDGIPLQR